MTSMPEKKSSYDWIKDLKDEITIFDPDGWDRKNFEQSMSELITKVEFLQRLMMSTISIPTDGQIWKPKGQK